jgi:hypothetical protein
VNHHLPRHVVIDECDLYALIRRAGLLAEGTLLDWDDDQAGRESYLRTHAQGTRDSLTVIRDQLAEHDRTVREDGLWVKLGLAFSE